MASAPALQVTLYTKPECSLCDHLKADLLAMQSEFGFSLVEHNIEADPLLFERFRYLIPVLEIDGDRLLYPPHQWAGVHLALTQAAARD